MSLEEKIKLMLFKIIYDKLKLNEIENCFANEGIQNKEIENNYNIDLTSKYFFLANDIHTDNLNEEEKKQLEEYLNDRNNTEKLTSFLEKNIIKLLIPNEEVKYIYYNGNDITKAAPSDAIVLQFHYIEYIGDEEKEEKQEDIINDKLNYIQSVLGPKENMKVAVLKYNEISNNNIKRL